MSDIRKYINIIDQYSSGIDPNDHPNSVDNSGLTRYVSLIESAMRVDESFKDAQAKFSDISGDEDEVKEYIENFKQLAKKNVIKGQDKDIGKWIKAGWDEFKIFVDDSSKVITKRQQTKKVKSDSITVYDDDDKMVVIPLSEKASCYYGKNTQWCTAATTSDNYFTSYFGTQGVTLFYIFLKDKSEKLAVARYPDGGNFEAFDSQDNSLSIKGVEGYTGISTKMINQWYNENAPHIERARKKYSPSGKAVEIENKFKNGEYSEKEAIKELNELIDYVEDNSYSSDYDITVTGYDGTDFLVDIEFILNEAEEHIKYFNGDEVIETFSSIDDYDLILHELDVEMLNHLTSYIMKNHLEEIKELLDEDDITRNDIESNIDIILNDIEGLDDVKDACNMAFRDAETSGIEKEIMDNIMSYVREQCEGFHLKLNKPLFELIDGDNSSVPIMTSQIGDFMNSVVDFELEDYDYDIYGDGFDDGYFPTALKEHLIDVIGKPDSEE